MRLLDRYLLRELLIPLGYCLAGLLIFYIAFDLIGSLNSYQEHKLLFADIVELYVVKIPEILVFILPIVLLLALLYALTNHARHHEITAIRAAGISLWRICVPYLVVGFLLSLALFAMNELWVPNSADRLQEILNRRVKKSGAGSESLIRLNFDNRRDGRFWGGVYNINTHTITDPVVHWKLRDGSSRVINADHADYIDGVWIFFGAALFSSVDVTNAAALADKLKKPARNDAVSQYLSAQLSPATQYSLVNSADRTNLDLPKILAGDFNRIIQTGPLYDAQRFAGVKLSPAASAMLDRDLRGSNLVWLNRALLMDAYPHELSKSRSYTVIGWKTGADSANPRPYLHTNLLAMLDFAETPDEFKRDIEFNNRFHGSAIAQSADIPVLEIMDYLRLHPDLDPKKRWLLGTQLYGRFAAPWTCIVVVLIAIPFSAGSGRRNIFVGVAGAIVICFCYFVLLKLGLALGTGGYLPGWLAAWLPNATFGIAGFWMMLRVR
jgi:lipopolysaccharide export LptBFGC system permease protein LptF